MIPAKQIAVGRRSAEPGTATNASIDAANIDTTNTATEPQKSESKERVMVMWFPDYPLFALRQEEDLGDLPLALADHRGIRVCDGKARGMGVRRGMKRRHAQSVCPELVIMDVDDDRDGRHCEEILADIDSISAGIELLRPGLVAVKAHPLARYYGSEETAMTMLLDAVARPGLDAFVGCADTIVAAVLAARRGIVIPPGEDAQFLAGQPLRVFCEEESLGDPRELVEALEAMGLNRVGQFAELTSRAVGSRFGAVGLQWWHIARADPVRPLAPREDKPDLSITYRPETMINRMDTVAFLGRQLAAQLHDRLVAEGVICQRVAVRAVIRSTAGIHEVERVWRSSDQLTEQSMAERIRWQLGGWLHRFARIQEQSQRGDSGAETLPQGCTEIADAELEAEEVGVIELCLDPIETSARAIRGLWETKEDQAVQMALTRVQTMLGPDRVCTPHARGGRGPGDRVALVPVGESAPELPSPAHQWSGQFPAPIPVTKGGDRGPSAAHPAAGIRLLDEAGNTVIVTGRVLLSARPAVLVWGSRRYEVTGWAGPWPVDEQWWEQGRRFARLQITTDEPCGLLLICKGKQWRIEGIYR